MQATVHPAVSATPTASVHQTLGPNASFPIPHDHIFGIKVHEGRRKPSFPTVVRRKSVTFENAVWTREEMPN
ncbi:MAG: hypothetical protein BGO01_00025 [Armatimonadetes bacterium 55-13]|nr:MAG: hypothetical protein BGO01_00025 [Armatimonadetes bacterium 55-13]